jgi:hypothetical protein
MIAVGTRRRTHSKGFRGRTVQVDPEHQKAPQKRHDSKHELREVPLHYGGKATQKGLRQSFFDRIHAPLRGRPATPHLNGFRTATIRVIGPSGNRILQDPVGDI